MEKSHVFAWICLTLLVHFSHGFGTKYRFFNFPNAPRSRMNTTALPPDCIRCQSDVGASCINAVCCSNLACTGGLCVPPGCGVLGATCAFGANQCCPGFNLDCLINPITNVGFTCQQCIPQSQTCNPNILPGTVGSCCFGLRCVNALCTPAIG